jgi:hypothetical protein
MSANYTPGAWYTKREGYSTVYVFSRIGGGLVQEVAACGPTNEGLEQQEANARLIAAAPELLEALNESIEREYNQFEQDNQSNRYKRLCELRAKATGGQQ